MFIPFDSEGHHFIGRSIRSLIGINTDTLRLSNGAVVSIADLMMLFGDYYGIAKEPISEGANEAEREQRFLAAFDTLDRNASKENIEAIIAMVKQSREAVEEAIKNNESTIEALDSCAGHETVGAVIYTKGEYIKLAKYNIDHFGESAILAYRTGHRLAIHYASLASKELRPSQKQYLFDRAVMLEACACHFLTDLFSSGHIQTPRLALHQRFGATIGGLLSLFMHNEDSEIGFEVKDQDGHCWFAKGDGHLFEADAKPNLERVKATVTVALEEIKQTFATGEALPIESSRVLKLIPQLSQRTTAPLYQLNEKQELLCREHLNDLTCQRYVPLTPNKAVEVMHYFAEQALMKSNKKIIKKIETALEKLNRKFLNQTESTQRDKSSESSNDHRLGFFHHESPRETKQPRTTKSAKSHCCQTL
jgi:hypothetical protein